MLLLDVLLLSESGPVLNAILARNSATDVPDAGHSPNAATVVVRVMWAFPVPHTTVTLATHSLPPNAPIVNLSI